MPVEHHSLIHEFPEFKEDIDHLKVVDGHFKKLHDEYHHLTREVEKREQEIIFSTPLDKERLKQRRLQLKDTIYGYIRASLRAASNVAATQ